MRQSGSPVMPQIRPAAEPPDAVSPPAPDRRPPAVERIAGWSVRHRKPAVPGWLLLVVAPFAAGQLAGSSNVPTYDPGQSGQAEQVMNRLHLAAAPPVEQVLIQPKAAGARYATDPAMRQAVRAVVAALHRLPATTASGIRSPLEAGGRSLISADGRAALVTFNVTGGNEDTAVVPAQRAVAHLQASRPGMVITEAGDASLDRIASATLSNEFRKAESTTLPVTLVLLLAVFGALIAA